MLQIIEFDCGSWNIKFEGDGTYRNWVLLRPIKLKNKTCKKVIIVMLNPGAFKNQKEFGKDDTLRKLRKAFENKECEIEILNLFNLAEANKAKFLKVPVEKRDYNKPIFERLEKYEGPEIILAWGKLDASSIKRSEEVKEFVSKKGFKILGIKSNNNTYFYHPRYCLIKKELAERFINEVVSKIS